VNKKTNTIVFLLGATAFNIVVTISCFVALLLVYGRIVLPMLPALATSWGLLAVVIGAVVAAFFIYKACLKIFMKRVDMEKYFDPLVMRRRGLRRE
jgi:hypothetical protein